jgi:hypothetical protein
VRVLNDYDSWETWHEGDPLDGLSRDTYGYVYDAQGHPKEFVSPGEPVEVDRRFYFDDKDRLSRVENVDPANNRDKIEFEYGSQGNRTKVGGTERSYDSECRITLNTIALGRSRGIQDLDSQNTASFNLDDTDFWKPWCCFIGEMLLWLSTKIQSWGDSISMPCR